MEIDSRILAVVAFPFFFIFLMRALVFIASLTWNEDVAWFSVIIGMILSLVLLLFLYIHQINLGKTRIFPRSNSGC